MSIYRSEELEELWPYGYSTVGEVTFESAAYTARYITKKLTGEETYRYEGKSPEFALMSRKNGIGGEWFRQYKSDCYPKDFVTHKGYKLKPPRYYDKLYEIDNPDEMAEIKSKRLQRINEIPYERRKGEALLLREKFKKGQTKTLKRSLEE